MKRTIITLLALLSLSLMVPAAYAQEYIPEVSTLSELQQAIAEAEPGDTIRLLQTIDVDTPVTIGVDGKPLTLRGADIMRKTHLSRFLPQTSYQGLP